MIRKSFFKKISLLNVTMLALASFSLPIIKTNASEIPPTLNNGIVFMGGYPPSYDQNTKISSMDSINGIGILGEWKDIEKTKDNYDWSSIDKTLEPWTSENKKGNLTIFHTDQSPNVTPEWIFNDLNLRRVAIGYWSNFENDIKGYDLLNGAMVTTDSDKVVHLTKSLYGESSISGYTPLIKTGTTQTLKGKTSYSIQLDYKGITGGNLYAKATSVNGGEGSTKVVSFTMSAGTKSFKSFNLDLDDFADYKIEIGIVGSGKVSIDNLNIVELTSGWKGITGFPLYTDPVFKDRYEKLVAAMAAKYDGNANINKIIVGGFARWDELTLFDDAVGLDKIPYFSDDLQGNNQLNEQWDTFGMTTDVFINHVKWCIDLYKKYFIKSQLMISAFGQVDGLYKGSRDKELINWTVPEYAASKGITIKHNGLQERLTAWNEFNEESWLFNRYKYTPGVSTVYETAGQVTDNYMDVAGHAISTLNRALIDGVDNMYFYNKDILDPNVAKYFPYINEQAGTSLISKFYNHLGLYNNVSAYDHNLHPVSNIWLGMRLNTEWRNDNNKYETIDGQRCVTTALATPKLEFDIDDRYQYNGMFGNTLSITYFDKGTDTFDVFLRDQRDNIMSKAETITKTGTNTWKTATLYKSGFNNSFRGTGADIYDDVKITDNGDGVESIKSVELDFVPAYDFLKEDIATTPISTDYSTISEGTKLSKEFTIPTGTSLSAISIPLQVGLDYSTRSLMGYLYGKVNGEYKLLSKKQYHMPMDKDLFSIPLENSNYTEFKVEVESLKGTIGWYKNTSGDLGLTTQKFKAKNDYNLISDGTTPIPSTGIESVFDANHNFGSWVPLTSSGASKVQISLYKRLDSNTWTDSISKTIFDLKDGENIVPFYYEPQTTGTYKIKVETLAGTVAANANTSKFSTMAMELMRREKAQPARTHTVGTELYKWDFYNPGKGDFVVSPNGLDFVDITPTTLVEKVSHSNASLILNNYSFEGKNNQYISFKFKNETASSLMRLYWKNDSTGFIANQSALIPVVPNDTETREYYFPIGLDDNWKGIINSLQLVPAVGYVEGGKVSLESFALISDNSVVEGNIDKYAGWKLASGGVVNGFRTKHSIEKTKDGLVVSGKGQYNSSIPSDPAITGVSHTEPLDAIKGFTVDLTVDEIGQYQGNGNDTWFNINVTNKPGYMELGAFYDKIPEGFSLLIRPESLTNTSCQVFNLVKDGSNAWTTLKSLNSKETLKIKDLKGSKIRFEFKRSANDKTWEISINHEKLSGDFSSIPKDFFKDGKAYFSTGIQTKPTDAPLKITLNKLNGVDLGDKLYDFTILPGGLLQNELKPTIATMTPKGVEISGFGGYTLDANQKGSATGLINKNSIDINKKIEANFSVDKLAGYNTKDNDTWFNVNLFNKPEYLTLSGIKDTAAGLTLLIRPDSALATTIQAFEAFNTGTSGSLKLIGKTAINTPLNGAKMTLTIERNSDDTTWVIKINGVILQGDFSSLTKNIFSDNKAYISMGMSTNPSTEEMKFTVTDILNGHTSIMGAKEK